jgi:hypothetical protein
VDKAAIDAARTERGRAADSLAVVATTNDFPTLEKHWASFLVSAGRVFTKLEQGAKLSSKGKAWWGNQLHQRRTDPLLRYLWHARNADEHTLQRINELQPAQAQVIEPTKEDIEQLERAMKKETRPWAPLGMVQWTPEHVVLLPVVDRGVRYEPPKEHLGRPIDNSSPAHIAALALAYLDAMLKQAEALLSPGTT